MLALKTEEDYQKRFQALIEKSTDVIALLNKKRRVEYVSPSVQKVLGYTPDELMAMKNPFKLIHPKESIRILKLYTEALKKPAEEVRAEFQIRCKNGDYRFIDAVATNYLNEEVIEAVVINFRDVTNEKKKEGELKRSKDQLDAILNNIADGIIVQDVTGKIIYANDSAARGIGYQSPSTMVSLTPRDYEKKYDFYDENGKLFPFSHLPGRRALAGEKSPSVTIKLVDKKSGTVHWSTIKSTVVSNANGTPDMVINVFTDITERKELDQRKDDFINMASHELKTPLTSARAFAQVLRTKTRDSQIASYTQKIDTQLGKLTQLVQKLLDVTRLQQGLITLEKSRVNLKDIANDVVNDLQPTTPHSIVLKWRRDDTVVFADREQISRVLTNLVDNAIKFSPKDKRIIVGVRRKKHAIEVFVQDFGIGIPENRQERIFERFYQVEKHYTYPGLGLGLFISSEILAEHGGKMWVESMEGSGSTFYFSLPL